MKSLNKFLGITALTMLILLIAAIAAGTVYVTSHKNLWNEFGNSGNFGLFNNGNGHFNFSINGERSSTFETLTTSQTDNFDLPKSIVLDIAVNDITFIKEDRTDIMIEYYNEHPDTPLYDTSYKAEETDNTLYVNTTYSVSDLFIDKTYDSYIKIHVPNNYQCDNLDLTMSLGEIKDKSIFDGAKNLNIHSKLGSVDLTIPSPVDVLTVTSDMGDISITTQASVKTIDAKASLGKIDLDLQDSVGALICDLDMGSLTINSNSTIENLNMTAKMGSIDGDFAGHVKKLTADANMGSINVSFDDNDDSTAYADANAGSINSDLPIVKDSADPDFRFYANMGSIDISTH